FGTTKESRADTENSGYTIRRVSPIESMRDQRTPEQRFRSMSNVKLKDGSLEVMIRSALHKRGYRFSKHVKTLPGSPDAVFPKEKVAVFIDGDFWHGYRLPAWENKLKTYWK